jgi:predicted transposase YbfD/YdcC
MDRVEYTSLAAALSDVPDPRQARGQRYPWPLLLVLISAALVSGQTHGRGISQWVREHAVTLRAGVQWEARHWPSEATVRRTLRHVDIAALEARLGQIAVPPRAGAAPGQLVGQAIDGKTVRGARAHGQWVHLVGLVRHDGAVLAQTAVDDKANEIVAAPQLLAGRDLSGTVLTMDALLTQRTFAQQIRKQGGHYLMVAKNNQPAMAQAIATLFADPPWLVDERASEYAVHRTVDKGHGRVETRTLEASPSLNDWLDWPDVGQVLRRTCRRVNQRTGVVEEAVMLGITSIPFHPRRVGQVERYWRGHWSIENRVHYVRDETLREDRGQASTGATAHALAALRNAILTRLRQHGWTNIADALRHYAAAPLKALALIGIEVNGL